MVKRLCVLMAALTVSTTTAWGDVSGGRLSEMSSRSRNPRKKAPLETSPLGDGLSSHSRSPRKKVAPAPVSPLTTLHSRAKKVPAAPAARDGASASASAWAPEFCVDGFCFAPPAPASSR